MINQLVRWLGLIMFLLGGSAFILSGINSQIVPFENWPAFTSGPEKLLANYSYFTLWSNLLGAFVGLGYFTNFRRVSPTLAKVVRIDAALMLTVTRGQLDVEAGHLLAKLEQRSPSCAAAFPPVADVVPHPLFTVVPGPVAEWERARP